MLGKGYTYWMGLFVFLLFIVLSMPAGAGNPPFGIDFFKGKILGVMVFTVDDQNDEDITNDKAFITISGLCMNTPYRKNNSEIPRLPVNFLLPPLDVAGLPIESLDELSASLLIQQLPNTVPPESEYDNAVGPPECWSLEGGETLWVTKIKSLTYMSDKLATAEVVIKAVK